jgi:hypothetical protein
MYESNFLPDFMQLQNIKRKYYTKISYFSAYLIYYNLFIAETWIKL